MRASPHVPVILFLFNRPDNLRRVVEVLRRVQPPLIFVIADGPRPNHPDDVARCRAARAVVEHFDWSCRVVRSYADTNMGCTARISSGLNWAFQEVAEAIVLEDDVVPHPTFFAWCTRMLDRYRDEPNVMHVSGRNHLGDGRRLAPATAYSAAPASQAGRRGDALGSEKCECREHQTTSSASQRIRLSSPWLQITF